MKPAVIGQMFLGAGKSTEPSKSHWVHVGLFPPGWNLEEGRADLKHSLRKIKVPLQSLQTLACGKGTHIPLGIPGSVGWV